MTHRAVGPINVLTTAYQGGIAAINAQLWGRSQRIKHAYNHDSRQEQANHDDWLS